MEVPVLNWRRESRGLLASIFMKFKRRSRSKETAACYADGRLKPEFIEELQRAQATFDQNVEALFGKIKK